MSKDDSCIQVSVCVPTYNHEQFIAQCLDSLIAQETSFRYEIIIGEDCSNDNTRSIIEKYAEIYPDLIVPIFYNQNVGAVKNVKGLYKSSRGKYIAHVDGDDLALANKLQLQFDILEEYKDCSICSHDMYCVDLDGNRVRKKWTYNSGKYGLLDLYRNLPFFAHSSKMFRNDYNDNFWDKLLSNPSVLDIEIHVENLKQGSIFHLSDFLGEYRIGSGVTSSKSVNESIPLGVIKVFEEAVSIFQEDVNALNKVNHGYALSMLKYAYLYAVNENDIESYNYYLHKSLEIKKIGIIQSVFKIGSMIPEMFFPLLRLIHKFLGYR